jgi:hypothetical protein
VALGEPAATLQRSPLHLFTRHQRNPMENELQPLELAHAKYIAVRGGNLTLFRRGPNEWTATGWEDGLPVARTPVTEAEVAAMLRRFPGSLVR